MIPRTFPPEPFMVKIDCKKLYELSLIPQAMKEYANGYKITNGAMTHANVIVANLRYTDDSGNVIFPNEIHPNYVVKELLEGSLSKINFRFEILSGIEILLYYYNNRFYVEQLYVVVYNSLLPYTVMSMLEEYNFKRGLDSIAYDFKKNGLNYPSLIKWNDLYVFFNEVVSDYLQDYNFKLNYELLFDVMVNNTYIQSKVLHVLDRFEFNREDIIDNSPVSILPIQWAENSKRDDVVNVKYSFKLFNMLSMFYSILSKMNQHEHHFQYLESHLTIMAEFFNDSEELINHDMFKNGDYKELFDRFVKIYGVGQIIK